MFFEFHSLYIRWVGILKPALAVRAVLARGSMIKISELPTSAERTSMVLQRVYEHRGNIQSFKYDDGKCLFTLQNCSEKEIVQNEACSVSFDFLGQLTLGYRVCDPFPADGIYYPGAADFI